MTDTETLRGIAVYNPDLLSKDELVAHFVARRPLLERLVDDLRRSTRSGNNQQHLIVGQRGMGKTTLLRRLRYAVEDDEELRRTWLPLTFPEEQYNVARLSDFYMNCADAVGDVLEADGRRDDAHALDAALDDIHALEEGARVRAALQLLLASADRLGKRLLLLVDNIELILGRLKDDQWAIRELLSAEKRLMLVGASAEAIEATYDYGAAFYDFFRIHELHGLTEVETREVLRSLARLHKAAEVERILDEDPARVRALHVLTGGNPRTIVLLYGILAGGGDGDVRSDLERLLDLCTPLYKARFESLPAQSQQVVDLLALHWDPIRAGDLAELARLDVNVVSSQLNRLAQQGLVEKVAYHPSTKTGFQIAERFFNIWYLMRASRRMRQRLLWLVQFLRLMYGQRAHAHLTHPSTSDAVTTAQHAEFDLALTQVLEDTAPTEPAWAQALLCFREAVRTGHAAEAVKLLDETNAGERWRPLREALHALAVGDPRVLLRVAPEVRQPAEQLMRTLTAENDAPPAGGPPPAPGLAGAVLGDGASMIADAPMHAWTTTARRGAPRKRKPPKAERPRTARRLRR